MDLSGYYREHCIPNPSRADRVLALLRTNTPEALAEAEAIVGRPIKVCPPGIPPWPPKPASAAPREPKVTRVQRGTSSKKLEQVKVGWTIPQVIDRLGVTRRDVKYWQSRGYLEVA